MHERGKQKHKKSKNKSNTSPEQINQTLWSHLIDDIGSDVLLANINKALHHYNEGHHEREDIQDIIDACEQYIKQIPINRRIDNRIYWKELQLPEWPHAVEVLTLQKQAVRHLFLPKAETETAARYELLKQLVLDDQLQTSPPGKMLEKPYWTEFRYKGKRSIADWVEGNKNKRYGKPFLSYEEVIERESKEEGLGRTDVQYLSDNKEYKIDIKDGLLYLNGKLFDTNNLGESGRWNQALFAVGRDGSLYVEKSITKSEEGEFHHSSLLSGKRVLCAGTLAVTNGRIQLITNNSGHYQPKRQDLVNFLKLLKETYQIDLSSIDVIDSSIERRFYEPQRMPRNALRYLKTKGVCKPENLGDMFFEWAKSANTCGKSDDLLLNLKKAAEFGHKEAEAWLARLEENEKEKEKNLPVSEIAQENNKAKEKEKEKAEEKSFVTKQKLSSSQQGIFKEKETQPLPKPVKTPKSGPGSCSIS